MDEEDEAWAKDIRDRCSTGDYERNGCELDRIMIEFMKRHEMPLMEQAFRDVQCYRS